MPNKPMHPTQWAKSRPPPTPGNRATERLFLDGHWQYGGRVHEEAAKALAAALSTPSDMATGHGLYLRLYTEYGVALETLGAWGWTFRNFRGYQLFLDAFLAYPHGAPRDFFKAVQRNRSGSLERLLRLSRSRKVLPVLADGFGWTVQEVEAAMAECMESLRFSAYHYFVEDEMIRTTYNKAKHGATILRTPDLQPREFRVVAPHLLVKGVRDRARYDITKFTVNRKMIRSLEHGCTNTGTMIRFLAGIARALDGADLLYTRRA